MSAERRADAFAQAISGKDEAAAQAQCTPRGWSADQDTPGSLYKQAVRKGLFLGAGVVLAEQDGRTAIAVPLLRVDQAGEEHILAGLHLLDTGSGLAGLTKNAQVAHLFRRRLRHTGVPATATTACTPHRAGRVPECGP